MGKIVGPLFNLTQPGACERMPLRPSEEEPEVSEHRPSNAAVLARMGTSEYVTVVPRQEVMPENENH